MTSQAGLLAILGFTEKINLDSMINGIASNDGPRSKFNLKTGIKMTTIGFAAGARSLLGIISTWNDAVLANIGCLDELPDDSTLGRIFKRQRKQSIADIESLQLKIEDQIKQKYLSPPIMRMNTRKEEVIDIDGTDFVSYGNQQGSVKGFNHKKKGANCYQALLSFDSISKTVKLAWLQSGNTHCANGIVPFTRQLHSHKPDIRKFYRIDSGFFSGEALDEFESQGNGYLVKAKLTSSIKRQFPELKWKKVAGKPGKKGWEEATFDHACDGWTRSRLFSVVRIKVDEYQESSTLFPEFVIEKYAYFCYVNTRQMSPWETHRFYGQRATCENYIEELKNQMNLGKIRSNSFDATTLFFHCAILSYNLMRWMTICTIKKRMIKWEMSSLRCFLIRISGLLRKPSGSWVLEFGDKHMYQEELDCWMEFFYSQ